LISGSAKLFSEWRSGVAILLEGGNDATGSFQSV
jgi:hypothetical protein